MAQMALFDMPSCDEIVLTRASEALTDNNISHNAAVYFNVFVFMKVTVLTIPRKDSQYLPFYDKMHDSFLNNAFLSQNETTTRMRNVIIATLKLEEVKTLQ